MRELPFQPADRIAEVSLSLIRQMAARRRDDTIDLGLGESDVPPAEWMRESAARVARETPWTYSPNAGLEETRAAVAGYLGCGDPARVCITAGSQEALYAVMQAWVGEGDEVLVPDPGFLAYPTLVRLAGALPVAYRLSAPDWAIDRDQLAAAISPRTKMIIVNTPSNPTGAVLSGDELEFIGGLAERHALLVVCDEVYRELWSGEKPRSPDAGGGQFLVVGGMSKSHSMTGLRAGWVAGDPDLLAPVIVAHQYITTCASVFAQKLMVEILTSDQNLGWLRAVREHLGARSAAAVAAWQRHVGTPVEPPQGAFYLFAPVPSCSTRSFAVELIEKGNVLAIPGVAFGREGEGWLRISYAAPLESIDEGIRRIARLLDQQESRGSCG